MSFFSHLKNTIGLCKPMQKALEFEAARRGILPDTFLELLIMQESVLFDETFEVRDTILTEVTSEGLDRFESHNQPENTGQF